jgi:hypothetical protein
MHLSEDLNKDLLLDFLNQVLKGQQGQIVDLTYLKTEKLGIAEQERKAIFDLAVLLHFVRLFARSNFSRV